tara:strand:+ start:3770 stop:4840 length:1071 start_codon:yes stop_codon:yes gene_type:complete
MARTGIKEIAARAGVSIATVSNSLRYPDRVSKETRQRVLSLIEELGYVPNRFGVGLRTSKSQNILVMIPDIADSFFHPIIKTIEQIAELQGYSVLLADTLDSKVREASYAEFASTGQADGILLFTNRYPFEVDAKGYPLPDAPPVVSVTEKCQAKGVPLVTIDNIAAAKDATNHLIELGHRNIAVVTGDMTSTSSQGRLQGYRKAMQEANLTISEENIIYGKYGIKFGEEAVQRILHFDQIPTAVLCFSDEIAVGFVFALTCQGINVSADISVMGFDNIPLIKYMHSPLSTIAQPLDKIGKASVELLLDMMSGKAIKKKTIVLEHELRLGISTRPYDEFRNKSDNKNTSKERFMFS